MAWQRAWQRRKRPWQHGQYQHPQGRKKDIYTNILTYVYSGPTHSDTPLPTRFTSEHPPVNPSGITYLLPISVIQSPPKSPIWVPIKLWSTSRCQVRHHYLALPRLWEVRARTSPPGERQPAGAVHFHFRNSSFTPGRGEIRVLSQPERWENEKHKYPSSLLFCNGHWDGLIICSEIILTSKTQDLRYDKLCCSVCLSVHMGPVSAQNQETKKPSCRAENFQIPAVGTHGG